MSFDNVCAWFRFLCVQWIFCVVKLCLILESVKDFFVI